MVVVLEEADEETAVLGFRLAPIVTVARRSIRDFGRPLVATLEVTLGFFRIVDDDNGGRLLTGRFVFNVLPAAAFLLRAAIDALVKPRVTVVDLDV